MACPSIITGDMFLTRVIAHLDCQAQVIGSYGFQALAQPGSPASALAATALTVFIALFGVRLLFGPSPGARDIVYDVLKIGIVISLAFSWPAFRTVIYNVVVDGPTEVASAIAGPLTGTNERMVTRMQAVDAGIVELIDTGTGRNSGVALGGESMRVNFSGTSLQDDAAFGWSRLLFIGGLLATTGVLRLLAGILLAIAPLLAVLLLFDATRGLFAGWARGLVLVILGSVGSTIVMTVQLAMIEPWLADALKVRTLGYATPSTPIELLAMTMGFAIVQLAMLWLLAKVAFYRGWVTVPRIELPDLRERQVRENIAGNGVNPDFQVNRVQRISDSVETLMHREEYGEIRRLDLRERHQDGLLSDLNGPRPSNGAAQVRLGESWRRSGQRVSGSARNRDTRA